MKKDNVSDYSTFNAFNKLSEKEENTESALFKFICAIFKIFIAQTEGWAI